MSQNNSGELPGARFDNSALPSGSLMRDICKDCHREFSYPESFFVEALGGFPARPSRCYDCRPAWRARNGLPPY